jgi:hypothetical protein
MSPQAGFDLHPPRPRRSARPGRVRRPLPRARPIPYRSDERPGMRRALKIREFVPIIL